MEKYFKNINYTAEDIAAGKYEAWDLIRPMWLVFDIYKDRARYEETAAQFTLSQRRAHAWVYYNNEVFNGGHQQFLINSTGIIWYGAGMLYGDNVARKEKETCGETSSTV